MLYNDPPFPFDRQQLMADAIFRIQFVSNGERYELYVKTVRSADIFGFVEIAGFIWNTQSQLVVDPSHEKLKNEFSGVESCLIPMHNVLRIDQVKQQGCAKISELGKNVMTFPGPIYSPGKSST